MYASLVELCNTTTMITFDVNNNTLSSYSIIEVVFHYLLYIWGSAYLFLYFTFISIESKIWANVGIPSQLHNWTFFHNFPKEGCRKKLAFSSFLLFFPGKKDLIFPVFVFQYKNSFYTFFKYYFFPGKKDIFFMVLKLSTIKQAFIEKVQ